MSSSFSARAPMLGYVFQARFSLHLLLDGAEDSQLVVEGLDDVVFEDEGQPLELLQLKHHLGNPTTLTDSSAELWKTLRVWSTHLTRYRLNLPDTLLTLITTTEAPDDTAAALLRPGRPEANIDLAVNKLVVAAENSSNRALETAFTAYLSLSPEDRRLLVQSIRILDASPNIVDVTRLIKNRIEVATRRQYLDALYERLEGWWFERVISQLVSEAADSITRYEVIEKVRDIAEQFGDDVLPLDYWELQPTEDVQFQDRVFVLQMKQIALISRRMELAIRDYYRAFEQRSRWAREDLLNIDELERYEARLFEEWERMYLKLQQDMQLEENESDDRLTEFGRGIYDWMEFESDVRIRPRMARDYIMRGSYHMLADQKRVWWHPEFLSRLESILTSTVES